MNKLFWIWNIEEHKKQDIGTNGDCCFNHIIGLPTKERMQKPIFDYQKLLYDGLQIQDIGRNFKQKHLWVKKATGLGVTEFFLRLMVRLCLKDDTYRSSQMCIVTGPNQDIAIKLIKRMKALFEPHDITFADKETVLELNGCTIEAFPSNHLDSYRALDNPKFIFIDEADFFRKSEQEDVRHVSERYIGKSDPYIVMVSTPNAHDGLFESIEKEPEENCIYKRLKLDYTYGLDRIYTREEIEKAKQSPSFEREYNLKYLGLIGNVFHTKDIDLAIDKGRKLDLDYKIKNPFAANFGRSMGIDPAYGSSSFGIVITRLVANQVQVLYADEFQRPDFNDMLNITVDLFSKFTVSNVYIDASNPSFIRSLKIAIGERQDYENEIAFYKKMNWNWRKHMTVIPISFNKEHKEMLGHAKMILEKGLLAINPNFDKLITALRTAIAQENSLDKEATSNDDILDAYQLALKNYEFGKDG
jgi:hypothetical protein